MVDAARERHVALAARAGSGTRGEPRRATSSTRSARSMLGPRRFEQYETRVARKSLSLPVWRKRNRPTRLDELAVGEQVEREVGCPCRSRRRRRSARRTTPADVPGVFERLPGALEEVAVLRIHDGRFLRAEAEELGVEHLDVFEHARRDFT